MAPQDLFPNFTKSLFYQECYSELLFQAGIINDRIILEKSEVDHRTLRQFYLDVLPQRLSTKATQKEIDAFQLLLFVSDLQFIKKRFGRYPDVL